MILKFRSFLLLAFGTIAWLILPFEMTRAFATELKPTSASSADDAVFDPARVIQIEIRLSPQDWQALRLSHPILEDDQNISLAEQGYDYYRGDLTINGQEIKAVGVRKKGAWGSVSSSRPSLKIKFDEYVKTRKLGELDMLTLNNCLHDHTKAQQLLVYSFMRKAGVPAPRSNLARVIVNGEDLGVYANVESIRKSFVKRHFNETSGDLYEPQNGADFTTNILPRVEQKWGRDRDLNHVKRLVDVLEQPGLVSLPRIKELVDLNSFITFWASEVMIGFHDGYSANQNNYYLYRDARAGKFFFIPWGTDSAFKDPGFLPASVPKSVKANGRLCYRLWELAEVRELYRREMARLLKEAWDEESMLSDLNRLMSLAGKIDLDGQLKAKEKADSIVSFITGRRKELQAELDNPARDWPQQPRWNMLVRKDTNAPMQIEGSFSAVIAEAFPPNLTNFLGEGSAVLSSSIEGKSSARFTRFGSMAITGATENDSTVVRIVATTADGHLRWNLAFVIDPYRMAPGTWPVGPFTIQTPLTQSFAGSGSRQGRYLRGGTLELVQTSTNRGGTIGGKFKLITTAFAEEIKED